MRWSRDADLPPDPDVPEPNVPDEDPGPLTAPGYEPREVPDWTPAEEPPTEPGQSEERAA